MNKAEVGTDNIYFEMEFKKETEARNSDEEIGKSETPAAIKASAQQTKKKGKPVKEADSMAFRPIMLIAAAVVAVAFLTAVASLVLTATIMLSRNNPTASKDSTDVNGEWNHEYCGNALSQHMHANVLYDGWQAHQ